MTKRIYTIFCVLIVIIGLNRTTYAQEVSIPDPNLESAVRNALELSEEILITQQLMQQLTSLNAKSLEITDLTGLEHATNLRNVNLNNNQISDLTPLAELTTLRSFSLESNQISNITPLAGLTNLLALRLTNNQISNITPLTGLTRLEELLLGSNQISNLIPLRELTQLVELDLESNQIRYVSALRGLTELEVLFVGFNQISSIGPLKLLPNLEELDITDNPITNVFQVHELIAAGVEVDFETSVPSESQVAQTRVLFNEVRNAADDRNDWIELRNISSRAIPLNEWEVSILIREGTTVNPEISVATFPDYTLPAGGVLLITNTDPRETTLLRGRNIRTPDIRDGGQHSYLVTDKLQLPNTPYMLILRSALNRNDTQEAIEDVAGTYFHKSLSADQPLTQGTAWQREAIGYVGYAIEAWGESGYQAGVGYQPTAHEQTSPGTPGYHNDVLIRQAGTEQISISEIMFTNKVGNRTVSQWIELGNNSATKAVDLTEWEFTIEARHSKQNRHVVLTLKDLVVLPKQTVLLVTGTTQNAANISDRRIYSLFEHHLADIVFKFRSNNVLSPDGFFLQLSTPDGVVVDRVGNLDGDSETQDTPIWELPAGTTADGARSSMLRRYHFMTRKPFTGTIASSWRGATDAKLGKRAYYGSASDVGNPGYTLGGILPVTLSLFRAEQAVDGVVIKWTTESEIDNAGFYIYRSETKDGQFKAVNPTMIQGAGTTGERNEYTWTDTTAKSNTVYYYRIEDVSHSGIREQLATVRLRGLVSATGKLTTAWADLKMSQ